MSKGFFDSAKSDFIKNANNTHLFLYGAVSFPALIAGNILDVVLFGIPKLGFPGTEKYMNQRLFKPPFLIGTENDTLEIYERNKYFNYGFAGLLNALAQTVLAVPVHLASVALAIPITLIKALAIALVIAFASLVLVADQAFSAKPVSLAIN